MKRTLPAARLPLPATEQPLRGPAFSGNGQRATGSAIQKDLLPPKDQMMAEFDSGQVPRSETWHTLITGLYLNFDGVNGMAAMYKDMETLTKHNQKLVDQVKGLKGNIEILYGQMDTWQQAGEASADTARKSQIQAKAEADRSHEEANRAKAIVDNFKPEKMVDKLIWQPLSICINYATAVQGNFIFFQSQLPLKSIFPAGVPHSSALCTTAPATIYKMNFLKNDKLVGWVSFQPGKTTGVFNWENEVIFMPGDLLKVQSQMTNEDAISGMSILLHGSRRFS